MKHEQIIDEILLEGLDDWVYSPVVVRTVEEATGLSGEPLLRATIEVLRELLAGRWMQVGDTTPQFEAWSLSVPEALARIERDWRAAGLDSDFVAVCWFANTPAGNERARKLRPV
jgi:hypothetical protein